MNYNLPGITPVRRSFSEGSVSAAGAILKSASLALLLIGAYQSAVAMEIEEKEPKNIFEAIKGNNIDALRDFIKSGVDINCKGHEGWTPLQVACLSNKVSVALVKMLIEQGAKVNDTDNTGWMPLHMASIDPEKFNFLPVLIAAHADINAQTNHGETSLHFACRGNNLNAVKVLIREGATIACTNNNKKTALDLAKNNNFSDIVAFISGEIEKQNTR